MHDDHHHHGHAHDHDHHHDRRPEAPSARRHGHNGPPGKPLQWQTPHLPEGPGAPAGSDDTARDLDLVETAFLEGFAAASDVTSFLRLAGIPFVGADGSGRTLHLLRVETREAVDVGAVMPVIGGQALHYDPLPCKMTSRRRTLAFMYHDGQGVVPLDFAAARALADQSGATSFSLR